MRLFSDAQIRAWAEEQERVLRMKGMSGSGGRTWENGYRAALAALDTFLVESVDANGHAAEDEE